MTPETHRGGCRVGVGGINYVMNTGGQWFAEKKREADSFSKVARLNPWGDVNKKVFVFE